MSEHAMVTCPKVLPLALSVTLGVLGYASAADAQACTAISGFHTGTLLQSCVLIEDELRVYADDDPDAPQYLYIQAERIEIGASGLINATASGFKGDTTGGNGPGPGETPSEVALMEAAPAGGGAHVGVGGQGRSWDCQALWQADGGAPYDTMVQVYDTTPENLVDMLVSQGLGHGSSGGASHNGVANTAANAGGRGGGVVILEAAEIHLEGRIEADGASAQFVPTAPGGGGGGLVWIRSPAFTFEPTTATISAKGGQGGQVDNIMVGGSGGGGLVVLAVDSDVSTLNVDVSGGPPVGSCNDAAGGGGLVETSFVPPACFDADGDGVDSDRCGGSDCNDADADAHPGASEVCDGQDDDCDGAIDEDDPESQLCPAGRVCSETSAGKDCVPVDGGTGAAGGGPAGAAGPTVEISGGLCAHVPGPLRRLGPLAWIAAAAGGLALWRRRRPG